ncbi:MAG: hypothetical protein NC251_05620 [Lachnoclostridium sp.]|nr:hypothetical protein [Lachnospira sp.]MCM1247890.1 hypothetical protein [Lachnoclostridium sp.]MCM1534544.1 hypothetical protein [Clostridium sp.]
MKELDSKVQKAVQILWIDMAFDRGQEAVSLLEQAVEEGNPDAYYLLARCYMGPSFVDPGFGFPDDDDSKVEEYLNLSIEKGSALGMFAARRVAGYEPRCGSFIQEPYHSSREIWDEVCRMADAGDLFTKYLVANAYYYGDVIKLAEINVDSMPKSSLEKQIKEWMETAIRMYDELLAKGMTMGVGNYIDIITSGDYGIPKNENKAKELRKIAADKGSAYYMVQVGKDYEKTQPEKAAEYFKRAVERNEPSGNFYLGRLYTYKGGLPRNLKLARDYFEAALEAGTEVTGSNNRLGEIYFYGGDGVEVDYKKAFKHLFDAHKDENYWGSDMLGTCYLKGLGIAVDYERAKEEFEHYKGEELSAVGLGEIYAYGLGVPVNIKTAMEHWNKFPNNPTVIEQKKKFKKTLFGWKRIDE